MSSITENIYWLQIKNSKLLTSAGIYVSGRFLQKGISFLLLPIIAQFMTPEDYGITGTLTAYSAVLKIFILMGLHGSVTRYYYEFIDSSEDLKSFIFSILTFQFFIAVALVLTFDHWGPLFWETFTGKSFPFTPFVKLALWTTFFLAVIQIPLSLYQAQQKAKTFALFQYGHFVLGTVIILILVIFFDLGALGVLWGQFVSGLLIASILLVISIKSWFCYAIKWIHIKDALLYGLPLVPHILAQWVMDLSDRVILERFASIEEIGLYSVGYTIGMVLMFLVGGINEAWMPHYFRTMKNGVDLSRRCGRYMPPMYSFY